ncbi:MAG: HD domain-containing protein [Chloroflexi bacterium]|nr:HD domain-containing protein [Chloroflexota bacterium]
MTPALNLPQFVREPLERLWSSGHAAYAVGGAVRDILLGREATDWDVATDARPEQLLHLFPGSHYQNRFGTVLVGELEITTFRRDHRYGDHRRPDEVTFTDDVKEDLLRRDFTVNAICWGRAGDGAGDGDGSGAAGTEVSATGSRRPAEPGWLDPTGGRDDLRAGVLRAVGDPDTRFDEDSLRLLRAARLAAQLHFTIEPATLAAMGRSAALVSHVSAERVGQELRKMLAARPPSAGFRILAHTGLLEPLLPELAEQQGVPQNKALGGDLWAHTLATVDAAAGISPGDERLLLAALLHDVGKPTTWREHQTFHHHEDIGAEITERWLARLAIARREASPIVELVRHHMFGYKPDWSDAAVRRLMRRVGLESLPDLFRLRQADNLGSGLDADAGALDELRHRVAEEQSRGVPLSLAELAIGGRDLVDELGMRPGPRIGALLDRLLDSVIADPARNTRRQLLLDARAWAHEMAERSTEMDRPSAGRTEAGRDQPGRTQGARDQSDEVARSGGR